MTIYRSSPTKRSRRTKIEIEALRKTLYEILEVEHPMTVRQVFYQMVSRGIIAKREAEYKTVVVRLLARMRMEREIPFDWISDNTRWQRKPQTFHSLEQALCRTAEAYRRCLWDDQPAYVEVWLEKDALAGVLLEETSTWDVPLMVTRGYSSLTYLFGAAESISCSEKPAFLYYFGDYDPSGIDIARNVEERLREFAPQSEIHFERVAVRREQISDWNLPTRPTKRRDSRSKSFRGRTSVEVDAIPPGRLRALVKSVITRHIDQRTLDVLQRTEASERETLRTMWEKLKKGS